MPTATLTRNEIRDRAARFVADWREEHRERAEKDTFWNEFLAIFGVQRRQVATFERYAKRASTGRAGYMDLFWPGYLIAEHKSRGKNLAEALDGQALDYLVSVPANQFPRMVVVSDFSRFRILDLDPETHERGAEIEISLEDLPRELDRFMFLAGYEQATFEDQDIVNVKAAGLLGRVYDELEESGYPAHELRVLIVRLLFILFADDTGLWPRSHFTRYLMNRTRDDGSDLGMHLARLFDVLNTPETRRTKILDEDLAVFPYVNGGLFAERLSTPDCTRTMRARLQDACKFDWSVISPAIFGSMFQSVMDEEERRQIGAHYTTERDIRKVIDPLFLDDLKSDFEACGHSRQRLRNFHERLGSMRFLDPAMGCGNFLVISYRELRRLETQLLHRLHPKNVQLTIDLAQWRRVSVGQFYGIELEEFPARIAETAMYLIDHLENEALGAEFGVNVVDLPLTSSAHVHVANALRLNWNDVLPAKDCKVLLGNPPFAGQKTRNADQTADLRLIWGDKYARWLDYVTAWYKKAADYLEDSPGRAAFVSTNSVTQGEQAARMWGPLVAKGIEIDFAHQTFNWSSEARGKAHVHCVVIGFSPKGRASRRTIYEYENINGNPVARTVARINPYLVDAPTVLVEDRARPLVAHLPSVQYGNKPADGGGLIVDDKDRPFDDPVAMKFLRRYLGARELLHNETRWCLWLLDADPSELAVSPFIRARLEHVRKYRAECGNPDTIKYADQPYRFFRIPQPSAEYIAIPRHVSQHRRWFTVAQYSPDVVASDAIFTAVDPDGFIFGVLSSAMFMAWLRTVGGRIKSDLRFSSLVVYNNFPLPAVSPDARQLIIEASAEVMAARLPYEGMTLGKLYDPLLTPHPIVEAHRRLDRAVDKLYKRRGGFASNAERLSTLFGLYSELRANEGSK